MAHCLQIITSGLLSAQVGIDAHVTGSAAQRLALAVRYMLFGLWVAVLLGHAKVDHMDQVGVFGVGLSSQKVVWLDITVDQVLFVDCLHPRQLCVLKRGM